MSDERYRFVVEWFDKCMGMKRRFLLSFFPSDGSVDMYDTSSKRLFLKRMKCDTISVDDLFVGNLINLLSRQLFVVEYGDKRTADKFAREVESTVLIVNESGFANLGKIITVTEKNGLFINHGKIKKKEQSGFASSSFAPKLQNRFFVFELRGSNAKQIVRKLLDPASPIEKPVTTELNELSEYCLGPTDLNTVQAEIDIFFPNKEQDLQPIKYRASTCCLIKPHAVKDKLVGQIVQDILNEGFAVSDLRVVMFHNQSAAEFYEVYKGIVAEYKGMVNQLASGSTVALEITRENANFKDVYLGFRDFVGPMDPDIARELRPGTLRATYGEDRVKNAVHCTDLPEDMSLELNYVFRSMSI